jgi:hypothetical protein
MAAILAEGPRSRPTTGGSSRVDRNDSHRADRKRAEVPVRLDPDARPPVPPVRPGADTAVPPVALGGETVTAAAVVPAAGAYAGTGAEPVGDGFHPLSEDLYTGPRTGSADLGDEDEDGAGRHRLLVIGLPLLALLVVVVLAWWVGTSVLSVAGSVDEDPTPSISVPATSAPPTDAPPVDGTAAGPVVAVQSAQIFNPEGDGEPENDDDVPLTVDGDPGTTWSTVNYRGSASFGNLKPGVGIRYDLGSTQQVAGVTVVSPTPGATVEIRTGESAADTLDGFQVAGSATLEDTTEIVFDEPARTRYVVVWVTGLVDGADGFAAQIAEVTVQAAG